ncbi:MAG: hypothetical protein Q8P20_04685 [bacterium]|nr:hypothetical protein [bacterium]
MTESKEVNNKLNEIDKNNVSKEKEVVSQVKKDKSISIKISSNSLISIGLVILILVSLAQAMELGNLKEKISTGEVKAATTNTTTSSGGGTTPSNLNDLPAMVGGC